MEKSIKLSKQSTAVLDSMVKFEQWESEFTDVVKSGWCAKILMMSGARHFFDAANHLKDTMYLILRDHIECSLGDLGNINGDTVEL